MCDSYLWTLAVHSCRADNFGDKLALQVEQSNSGSFLGYPENLDLPFLCEFTSEGNCA